MPSFHNRGHLVQLEQLKREERKEIDKTKNLPVPTRVRKVTQIKLKYQKLKSDLRHNLYNHSLRKD